MAAPTIEPGAAGPQAGLLEEVREQTRLANRAEIRRLELIVEYCAAHEVDPDEAATYLNFGQDTGLALAGVGAPCVSEFAVMGLAAVLGMTADAARALVGRVLEVRYRLPGFWEKVTSGELAWWRAGRVAEHTISLPVDGARFVDARLAWCAPKITWSQVERLCAEALDRYAPAEAEAKRQAAADRRRVEVHTGRADATGVLDISGTLDTADALDLEAAVAQVAADLAAAGCDESLDVRRSMALGLLARRQLAFDLNPEPREGGGLVKPRRVTIHVHVADQQVGRCETTRSPVTVEQVAGWCTNPDTQVVIRQVIDLNAHLRVDQYEVPDRLNDQASERDGTCVFPWCTRPATSCDKDHCVPHEAGGPTCSCNIAALCRRHHRVKTHGGWAYRILHPGTYLWASPHGYWYHRDGTGTTDLGHHGPPGDGFGDPPHP